MHTIMDFSLLMRLFSFLDLTTHNKENSLQSPLFDSSTFKILKILYNQELRVHLFMYSFSLKLEFLKYEFYFSTLLVDDDS